MNSKYTAVVLAVFVAAASAGASPEAARPSLLAAQQKNWEGLGLRADVNEYIDKTIGMLVPVIKEHGLDPMPLPDVTEGFEVRPLWVTYSAWLSIHSGHMTGLVNVERSGDQRVNYFANMLRLRLEFKFNDLEFVYRYLVKVMNIGPTGGLIGSLDRFVVVFDLLIDFNNDELHLQEFALKDIGRLRVRFTGNILIDWLVNPVVSVFTRIFDTVIINAVRVNIASALQDGLDFININIADIIKQLESYGQVPAVPAVNFRHSISV